LVPFQAEYIIGGEELIQISAAGVEAGNARVTGKPEGIVEVKLFERCHGVRWPVFSHRDLQSSKEQKVVPLYHPSQWQVNKGRRSRCSWWPLRGFQCEGGKAQHMFRFFHPFFLRSGSKILDN
jgi:hypothetical protein